MPTKIKAPKPGRVFLDMKPGFSEVSAFCDTVHINKAEQGRIKPTTTHACKPKVFPKFTGTQVSKSSEMSFNICRHLKKKRHLIP